jgi:hypothetical protein
MLVHKKINFEWFWVMIAVVLLGFLTFLVSSCTISLTNASSIGKATDMVDSEQTASPDVKTDLSIPLIK